MAKSSYWALQRRTYIDCVQSGAAQAVPTRARASRHAPEKRPSSRAGLGDNLKSVSFGRKKKQNLKLAFEIFGPVRQLLENAQILELRAFL